MYFLIRAISISCTITLIRATRIDKLIYLKRSNKLGFMENLVKKLEEQITFLQQEMSQLSSELYSQQKEIMNLKKKISNFIKRIEELDSGIESSINIEDKKPPHY
jgi:SlyX protein